jgi:hypothetical protein
MAKITAFIQITVDTDEYPTPSDNQLSTALFEDFDMLADNLDGIRIKNVTVKSEVYT